MGTRTDSLRGFYVTSDRSSRLDDDPAFALHRGGKLEVRSTVPVRDADDLSLAYTPGWPGSAPRSPRQPGAGGRLHLEVQRRRRRHRRHRRARPGGHRPGGRHAGHGGQGAAVQGVRRRRRGADLPRLHRRRRDSSRRSSGSRPSFGGINLEDISAPRCFEIEDRLRERLDIPVFHDDQHGTAIVVLAALRNAARLTGRDARRPARGGGRRRGVRGRGVPHPARGRDRRHRGRRQQGPDLPGRDGLNPVKAALAARHQQGRAAPARPRHALRRRRRVHRPVRGATVPEEAVAAMADDAIVFALANPDPEVHPEVAAQVRARWWRPGAATSRTRSTTCWPSRASSAARSTSRATHDHREHEARGGRRRWPTWSATTSPPTT